MGSLLGDIATGAVVHLMGAVHRTDALAVLVLEGGEIREQAC